MLQVPSRQAVEVITVAALQAMADPLSRLVAAGVIFRSGRASPQVRRPRGHADLPALAPGKVRVIGKLTTVETTPAQSFDSK